MKRETRRIIDDLLAATPALAECEPDIRSAYELLRGCFTDAGKLLICGNGGSACDSSHIAGELMKGFQLRRQIPADHTAMLKSAFPGRGKAIADSLQRALPALSLPDQTSVMTAFSNDVAADMAFAQMVYGLGRPGDAFLGISTSGSARSVVHAAMTARAMGLYTIGLTGHDGGELGGVCDVAIRVPSRETYRVQEYHVCVYHALCAMLEYEFFAEA
ncbi:MAG: SIS domain-containing protein [Clostridiales bacterium]|nr:SIS domain-containing protein [Clostridiales bacterium]